MDLFSLNDTDIGEALSELLDPVKYRSYLQVMSNFSSYSWRNVFLIYKQMPHASKFAEFEVWRDEYGRNVIKGSKGIKINIPILQKSKKNLVEKIDPVTGAAILDENGKRIMEEVIYEAPVQFKQKSMHDISQTKGNPVLTLAGDVMSDESLRGVFTDVLRAMPPFNAIQAVDYDIQADMYDTIKQIVRKKIEYTVSDKVDFITDSVAYVIYRRFVAESEYYIGLIPKSMDFLDANILETIIKYSDDLITTIEDRFSVICKERGLDPMTLPKINEIKPLAETNIKPPTEPQYTKELRTEKVAGVEFSQYTVKPYSAQEEKTADKIEPPILQTTDKIPLIKQLKPYIPIEPPTLKYLPDTTITISERNQYGYTRPELLPINKDRAVAFFRRDMTVYLLYKDNTEAITHYISDIQNHDGIFGIAYGAWINSREYIALASGNPEAQQEARFIYDGGDSFAVYQTEPGGSPAAYKSYEELQTEGLDINRHNYNLVYTAPLPSPPSDTPAGLFMWVNAERLEDYNGRTLTISDVLSIKKDEIITSYYANGRTFKELLSFIGEEGQKSERRNKNEIVIAEQNTAQKTQDPAPLISNLHERESVIIISAEQSLQPEPQAVQIISPPTITEVSSSAEISTARTVKTPPPALPVIKSDLSLYRASAKEAEEHGTTELYEINQRMNNHCVRAIENAIQAHKKGDNRYDLKTPAGRLIKIYGKERMMWVLSKHILSASDRFSEINRSWAGAFINDGIGSGDEIPTFSINTHHAVLEAFINECCIIFNKNPTFNERMKTAKKKSEAYNNSSE